LEKVVLKDKRLIFMGIGFELVGLVIGSVYFGGILDAHFGWQGMGVVGLIVLTFAGWLVHFIVLIKRFMADEPIEEDKK
jgi:MFS family permease